MQNEVIKFLSGYLTLSEDEAQTIIELSLVRSYKKGTILLREGEMAKNCYLVLKGCVRS